MAYLDEWHTRAMRAFATVVGIVVGIPLALVSLAACVAGFFAMGTWTPKALAFFGGLLLIFAAVALIGYSVGLWRLRSRESA